MLHKNQNVVNYTFKIEYEGSRYLGWQRLGQENRDKSIQGKMEQVLSRLYHLPAEAIEIIASGRTDAGVHAKEQVANVHLPPGKEPKEIEEYCNHYLPEDIRIFDMQFADPFFHSRFHAKQKEYVYRISFQKPSVFERNFIWTVPTSLDIEKMRLASLVLLGEHDFLGFSSLKKTKKSTVRTLERIDIIERHSELSFHFLGSGFLQNMVRILVGTLIEIGEGKKTKADLLGILQRKKRAEAGFLAPAKGLILHKVFY